MASMVVFLCENLVVAVDADQPPVAEEDVDVDVGLDLADEGFEIVSAVAVDDDDFSNAVFVE